MRATLLHAFPLACLMLALSLSPAPLRAADATDKSNSPPNVLSGRALVQALRGGGYVLYFRHGSTDLSTRDSDRTNLANCATQRSLSDEGRKQMADIGRSIKALGIRISVVRTSPYCRSIETARLAFGSATLEPDLTNTVIADEATAARQARALRALLALAPEAGSNAALSGHTGNLQEASGIWPSPEGVAIVFKPDIQGGFQFVARVLPTDWQKFLKSSPKAAKP